MAWNFPPAGVGGPASSSSSYPIFKNEDFAASSPGTSYDPFSSTASNTDTTAPSSFDQLQTQANNAAVFLQSDDYLEGRVIYLPRPPDISPSAPLEIRRPRYPEKRKRALQMMDACQLYVQFPCVQKCRSLGICVHYQFIAGCRRCPDGLICQICMGRNCDMPVKATRKCPLHQDPQNANPINSLPEDFLATDAQKQYYDEVLQRSLQVMWDDIPPPGGDREDGNTSVDEIYATQEHTHGKLRGVKSVQQEQEQMDLDTAISTGRGIPRYLAPIGMEDTVAKDKQWYAVGTGSEVYGFTGTGLEVMQVRERQDHHTPRLHLPSLGLQNHGPAVHGMEYENDDEGKGKARAAEWELQRGIKTDEAAVAVAVADEVADLIGMGVGGAISRHDRDATPRDWKDVVQMQMQMGLGEWSGTGTQHHRRSN